MSCTQDHLKRNEMGGLDSWIEYDARGIPVGRVCAECVDAVRAKYRPEIFTDPQYDTMGETVEEDI